MARYDIGPAWFTTPRGHRCLVYVREGTNDWNTACSCLNEDEYGTRDLDLDGLCLDVGGHLGAASLAVLLDHPGTRALIVEPIPDNAALIARNLDANGVPDRATVIEGAVGQGQVTVAYGFTGNENDRHHAFVGNIGIVRSRRKHREISYQALSYADVAPGGASFVKIDCEGGEWGFLSQLRSVPLIVGEIHPLGLPEGWTSRALLTETLGATHDITFAHPTNDPVGFRAVLHAGAVLSPSPRPAQEGA